MQFKKGSFPKNTAVGTQAITGLGFQPRAVIFFWTRQTAADTFNPDILAGYGFATGPANERAVAIASLDGVFGGDTGKGQWQSSSIVLFSSATPVPIVAAQAELASLDGNGFTLNWTVNEARADIIHYVALGGSDIVNAKVDSFVKATGTGNLPVTGVGFKPDFVMFLAAHTTAPDVSTTEAQVAIGFASSPTERGALGVQLEDADGFARGTCSWQRADRVLLEMSDTCAPDTEFDLASFDPDGFTVNRILNNNDTRVVHYLALQGGKYKVGSFNKSTAFPPVDQSVAGVGFPAVGLILASKNRVTNLADETNARISLGAGDGTTEGATWWHDAHAISSDNNQRTTTSKIALHASGAGAGALDAEADLKSLDSDGFTLTWTTNNDLAAHEILYVAFGGSTNYRSIGTAPDYTTGSVTATTGSAVVTGAGTTWKGANRGRGDRILIDGTEYTVLSVDSETQLTLTSPFTGVSGAGKAHTISRQYSTFQAWEDCISGVPAACSFFPVASASLVADNRAEVGVAYKDSVFTSGLVIDGSTTDATHTITLTADHGNRHYGMAGNGVVLNLGGITSPAIQVMDDYVSLEWFEITGGSGSSAIGIHVSFFGDVNKRGTVRNNLIHDMPGSGIEIQDPDSTLDIYNNIVYETSFGIRIVANLSAAAQVRILNNTVYSCNDTIVGGPTGVRATTAQSNAVTLLRNNIAHSNLNGDFGFNLVNGASSNNLAGDTSGTTHSPAGGGLDSVPLANLMFVSTTPGSENLHILPGTTAANAAADLSAVFTGDIDGGARAAPWDIGADDIVATTAVELASFEARGLDRAVELTWVTASELNNLGFHLYRATSAHGAYERITSRPIPGLGSSPVGAKYRYHDSGLENEVTYHYMLEDVETTGGSTLNGPVFATPSASASGGGEPRREGSDATMTYGRPEASSLEVLERGPHGLVLELRTEGFQAIPQDDGSVRLAIPGFELTTETNTPALPIRRAWVDAVAGRKVRLVSVKTGELESFSALYPAAGAAPELEARSDGTVRAAYRRSTRFPLGDGLYPREGARLMSVGFQGETKKALVELAPLRWDGISGRLILARRLVVVLSFSGRELGEASPEGIHGRRYVRRPSHRARAVLARLATREKGLYAVRYEELLGQRRVYPASALRLSRLGETRPFHLEPDSLGFGPGSVLYFVSEGASGNSYGPEAVFDVELGVTGERMAERFSSTEETPVRYYWHEVSREENRFYQAGLLDAADLWLWDLLFAPARKDYDFRVSNAAGEAPAAVLDLRLQGASDFPTSQDHHVRVFLNDVFVAEARWDGKRPQTLQAVIPQGILNEGDNSLTLENVGDTEAAYSMVFLDRFAVRYPRRPVPENGVLEGLWSESGEVEVPASFVVDLTEPGWVRGKATGAATLRVPVVAGRKYLMVGDDGLLRPEIRRLPALRLKSQVNGADYVLIGPTSYLDVAGPLVELRRQQGLRVKAVSVETIFSEFGFGEARPEAIKDFLAYAYHHWEKPSPRYVVLLGDGTYDYKDYLGTGVENAVPPLLVRTSYLWTASDPALASVNGADILPDLALGRLPAASVEEARRLVSKIVAYESAKMRPDGATVLVADNPDAAGDFEADAEGLAAGVLSGMIVERIYVGRLGPAGARQAVVEAFDRGASLMSYVGHGGIHLWASENILDTGGVDLLSPQAQQPLVLTMNCLNGYWHFPYFNSLGEELLKAEAKGAIAAFSPSGLSLNEAAARYHEALLRELVSARHERLGDAVMAAQAAFAAAGALPELLQIYHLLGDPALRLR